MKKQITLIRDIEEIEKLLLTIQSGVLCIHLTTEKLYQIACNFVYLDKNVYIFLDGSDENYENINYGALGSFTITFNEKVNTKVKDFTYKLSYVTINGEIKNIDENKLIEQITDLYRQKYSAIIPQEKYILSENLKPVILDSNEIKALIEEGI